jgi:serralysin
MLSAPLNTDSIGDFAAPADTIQLENAVVFSALTTAGILQPADFASVASDGNSVTVSSTVNLIYDRFSGYLYYDSNGGEADGRTLFAALSGAPDDVTRVDFVVT